jgi:hypothetical protein
MRAARGYDKAVGDGALAFEIDENDVLGFVVVQTGQDQVLQSGGATLVVLRGLDDGRRRRGRDLLRTGRGLTVQRGAPLISSLLGP